MIFSVRNGYNTFFRNYRQPKFPADFFMCKKYRNLCHVKNYLNENTTKTNVQKAEKRQKHFVRKSMIFLSKVKLLNSL